MSSGFSITRLLMRLAILPWLLRLAAGPRVWAVAMLTWRAAFRFRLFWVLSALLIGAVVVLPLLLKDDGTARGFTQILLTYTLSVMTALLGFATLWLACGTLARDIEEGQMQVVAAKPVARWQIWIGKWLGILLLNAALLTLAGSSVYGLMKWRAQRLPPKEQAILRNEIFVARASLREPAPDLDTDAQRAFAQVPNKAAMSPEEKQETLNQLRLRMKAVQELVPPNYQRVWTLNLGLRKHLVRDQPLFLRIKFYAADTNVAGTYLGLWRVGPIDSPVAYSRPQSLASATFHEIEIQPNLFDDKGVLTITFENRNDTALIFPLDEGLEVLYREGGFGLNFFRAIAIIWCWLALLASLGLAASSLMSFPVAAFFSFGLLVVALSSGTLSTVVQEGSLSGLDHESGAGGGTLADRLLLPMFRGLLTLVNLVQEFSPVDALSTGRSITWGQLGRAFGQIVLLLGGLIGATGIVLFTRRELATAQGTH